MKFRYMFFVLTFMMASNAFAESAQSLQFFQMLKNKQHIRYSLLTKIGKMQIQDETIGTNIFSSQFPKNYIYPDQYSNTNVFYSAHSLRREFKSSIYFFPASVLSELDKATFESFYNTMKSNNTFSNLTDSDRELALILTLTTISGKIKEGGLISNYSFILKALWDLGSVDLRSKSFVREHFAEIRSTVYDSATDNLGYIYPYKNMNLAQFLSFGRLVDITLDSTLNSLVLAELNKLISEQLVYEDVGSYLGLDQIFLRDVYLGKIEDALKILDIGADIRSTDMNGNSALHLLFVNEGLGMLNGTKDSKVLSLVKELIAKAHTSRLNFNGLNNEGLSPLTAFECRRNLRDYLDGLSAMIDAGADILSRDEKGKNFLDTYNLCLSKLGDGRTYRIEEYIGTMHGFNEKIRQLAKSKRN